MERSSNTAKMIARWRLFPQKYLVPAQIIERPSFKFEVDLSQRGFALVAGLDEAGRGPLAGPVVAAAVIFPAEWFRVGLPEPLRQINDSKKLSAGTREALYSHMMGCPEIRYGIARVDSDTIDRINILEATHRAMNLALAKLEPPPQHVLVDGLRVKSLTFPQTPIVSGDTLSCSIAAASILAKVTRDRLMVEFDREYPGYGFAGHKGYGTGAHLAALKELGPCPIHRQSFSPVRDDQPGLFSE